ncbi:MBL fold metallo-hydrolase [Candidatus Falkowbacteria bacterium]|nr:MBL fold metallo-hydrolase [Candidatus Falkowbacteria bacterium]
MKISFHGACRTVTGSCFLVQTEQSRFLVDCGMFQGTKFSEERNIGQFGFDPKSLDFVLLTHAHTDHCGRLPKLCKEGFRGPVYCTAPTRDFARVMLLDSARVIFNEALAEDRLPLYLDKDVNQAISQCIALPYRREKRVAPDVKIKLRDAGHILGSAFFEIWVKAAGRERKLVFSGDLGNPPAPIIEDTEFVDGADVLVMESTYGGRQHESAALRLKLLTQAIIESVGQGGTLMIPAFALERTQEILYELNSLVENKKIPPIPIFVDSPLAIKATEVYKKYTSMYDAESRALMNAGDDLFNFPGLRYTATPAQSKKINTTPAPKVILAGSGMLAGGRIGYHLKFNLPDPKSHLLIISWQPKGGLGRQLLEGAKSVFVAGERVRVRAKVSAIGAYSAHADQPKLLRWVLPMKRPRPGHVFVVHGEEQASQRIADGLAQKLKLNAIVPREGRGYEV